MVTVNVASSPTVVSVIEAALAMSSVADVILQTTFTVLPLNNTPSLNCVNAAGA